MKSRGPIATVLSMLAAAALAVLLALATVGVATASAGEDLGPIPAELPVSRCAPVSFSPHVVKVGGTITGTAGPATDACGGPASSVSWEWTGATGSQEIVSGCKNSSSTCVLRAVFPTGTKGERYEPACIDGSSPFGGWDSCDYYAVEGCGGNEASPLDLGGPLDPGALASDLEVPVCCPEPKVATTARAVRQGTGVEVKLRATRLGSLQACGRARLSINRGGEVKTVRRGSTETGHVTLRGRASCFANVEGLVVSRNGRASATAEVEEGTPVVQTARAHRAPSGAVEVTAKFGHLRPAGTCGEVLIEAETSHAGRTGGGFVQIAHFDNFSGTSATAHVTLKRTLACLETTKLKAVQGSIETPTARAVRVTGKEPVRCSREETR